MPAFVELNTHPKTDCSLVSVNNLKTPALLPAPTLQLALNLLDFGSIAGSDGDFAGEDDVQHVNERVSRDIHQFSEHGLVPWRDSKSHFVFAIRLPEVASCKWMKMPLDQLDRRLKHRPAKGSDRIWAATSSWVQPQACCCSGYKSICDSFIRAFR
jgi:hypothetical protein